MKTTADIPLSPVAMPHVDQLVELMKEALGLIDSILHAPATTQ